jgi:hypothetical protein
MFAPFVVFLLCVTFPGVSFAQSPGLRKSFAVGGDVGFVAPDSGQLDDAALEYHRGNGRRVH